MRDKLIELIGAGFGCPYNADKYSDGGKFCKSCEHSTDSPCWAGVIADYLIANGVTFADVTDNNVGKWIPVSERLPERTHDVLLYFGENTATGFWHGKDETNVNWCSYTDCGWYTDCESEPTHWMPLPEPPKEGE